MKIMHKYVHGYSERESRRLADQAETLTELLHHDSVFSKGSRILEAGCGTGAQTITIASKNPGSKFLSVDISERSLSLAKKTIEKFKIKNVELLHADIFNLEFPDEHFDHIFICFVLEHLKNPLSILKTLKRFLKKNGSITVIEGDHGSAYFYPQSTYAVEAINAQVKLQSLSGGNALIGRELYPLLKNSGYKNCKVSPRVVYADSSKPGLVRGFTKNTFTAMIEGVREEALKNKIMTKENFDQGIKDLFKTAGKDGVFCYTFFKAVAYK